MSAHATPAGWVIPELTKANQALAAEPDLSAWVAANAGSGKTHVLVNRVLRLLLDGVAPGRMLCITYTKAAAANMSNRLFRALSEWAVADDEALRATLAKLTGQAPGAAERRAGQARFRPAIDARSRTRAAPRLSTHRRGRACRGAYVPEARPRP